MVGYPHHLLTINRWHSHWGSRGRVPSLTAKNWPKIGEKREKIRKKGEKSGKRKILKVLSLCPSWQIALQGYATAINRDKGWPVLMGYHKLLPWRSFTLTPKLHIKFSPHQLMQYQWRGNWFSNQKLACFVLCKIINTFLKNNTVYASYSKLSKKLKSGLVVLKLLIWLFWSIT